MTSFITTKTSKFLTSLARENACSENTSSSRVYIKTLAAIDFKAWLNNLTSKQAQWVADSDFSAAKDQTIKLFDDSGNITEIILGLGDDSSALGIAAYADIAKSLAPGQYQIQADTQSTLSSIGWAISQYEFDRYKAKKNSHNAVLVVESEQQLKALTPIVNGICLVRDLVNTPACDMGPSHLSAVMQDLAKHYSADFSEIVGDELLEKRLNTIHAVGRAAKNKPRLLELLWGDEEAPKLTLVGKGVCFDTGGLDLKGSAGMRIMKKDMGGAAHTLGIAQMIMGSGLKVRLRLLIPAVENNISEDAFRPGDIITTYKGTTVEVDNTDAEGRLVLCDALALASEEEPELLINFATLTGAARVAMGTDVVPFFTDNDDIAASLAEHSKQQNDPTWRLPLHQPYAAQLKSNFADMRNMGSGPFGGAIVAALYLKHFVSNPSQWVHFDMYAWNQSERSTCPEGGEAMAIRAVFAYLEERFGS
ncbi:MAG: leucyl aminopeptidase [Enterobacterales bacterium]|jgi:leucyl aminopeptidase